MNQLFGSYGSSADFSSTSETLGTQMPGWTGASSAYARAPCRWVPDHPLPPLSRAEELQNLDMETTKLLASVRGEDKPKKKAPKKEAAGGETVRSLEHRS